MLSVIVTFTSALKRNYNVTWSLLLKLDIDVARVLHVLDVDQPFDDENGRVIRIVGVCKRTASTRT